MSYIILLKFGVKMKKVAVILSFLLVISIFASCQKKENTNTTTQNSNQFDFLTATTQEIQTQQEFSQPADNQIQTENTRQTQYQTSQAENQTQEEITQSKEKVITYISENPDNIYICKVAEKYSSNKADLIAFIKVNAATPGATVLEFSGKRDENGKLITTVDELKYVYDVPDNGTIKRASADGRSNDGYGYVAAKTAIMLAQKYFIPSIDDMRAQRRYEDYF